MVISKVTWDESQKCGEVNGCCYYILEVYLTFVYCTTNITLPDHTHFRSVCVCGGGGGGGGDKMLNLSCNAIIV